MCVRFVATAGPVSSRFQVPGGIDLDGAVAVRDRWVGTGNLVRIEPIPRITDMEIQYRPELARPTNGLRDRVVRQAFYQAINREQLMEVMTLGLGAVADSWFMPNDPNRAAVEAETARYPYDPAAALRLLADAGWTRGADGILVHQPSGERFDAELSSRRLPPGLIPARSPRRPRHRRKGGTASGGGPGPIPPAPRGRSWTSPTSSDLRAVWAR